MTSLLDWRPPTLLVSLLAGLTTWVTLLAWTPFAEFPSGYMVPLFGACVLVAVSGMLLRAGRLAAPMVALAQLVLVLVWLHHRLAGSEALGGYLPTPDSIRAMADAVHRSSIAAQTFSSPVPASVPDFYPLLIMAGAGTAILVDLLAVGLRRAPLAGLPLLAVYTAPVSILAGGVPGLKFAAAALCFLFLIAAAEDQRLSRWGQLLTPRAGLFDNQRAVVGGPAVWSAARRIGVVSTGLAVAAPFLVPTVTASWFGGGTGTGTGLGGGVNISNPIVDLKRDLTRGADVNVLSITTTDPDPSYLRISVLNSFDGNTWRPAGRQIPIKQRADGAVPRAPGLAPDVATKQDDATIRVTGAFSSRWLPTPYPVSSVTAPGDWRYDKTTMDFLSAADDQTTAGLTYKLRSLRLDPTARQLASALPTPLSVYTPNTTLPHGMPRYVARLAENVTKGKRTKFEQAVALQQFFRVGGGFRYSLARSAGNGADDLVRFLSSGKDGRVGFCEQFAAAMAVMGRTLGIPSRVAVGFLRPERTSGDTWVYSTHDLHAWPEMYFGGVGWVRFEPTPQQRTGGVPSYTTQQVPQASAATDGSSPSSAPTSNRVDKAADSPVAAKQQSATSSSSHSGLLGWAVVPVLLGLLLLVPRGARTLLRRRRWAATSDAGAWVEAGWRELRDSALDLGIAWDDRLTLRTWAASLAESFGHPPEPGHESRRRPERGPGTAPEAVAALGRMVDLLERARYSRSLPGDATSAEQVAADVDVVVAALRAGVSRGRAARATWLPASLLDTVRARRVAATRRGTMLGAPGVDRAV